MIPTQAIVYGSGVDLVLVIDDEGHHETIPEWDADTGEFIDHPWDDGSELHLHMLEHCRFEWERVRGMVGSLEDR